MVQRFTVQCLLFALPSQPQQAQIPQPCLGPPPSVCEEARPRQKVKAKVRRSYLHDGETGLGYLEMETRAKGNK